MLNSNNINLDALIQEAEKCEEKLWGQIQQALRETGSSKIYSSLKDFLLTSQFQDVGESIQTFFNGTLRQYEALSNEGQEKYLDNMFLSFQDHLYRVLSKHNVQENIIQSLLSKQDLKDNFKSGYTGRFENGKTIIGGGQSLINEMKEELMRAAWTSQFPEFDFTIEPWGAKAHSTDMKVTMKYQGPRGGKKSLTFFEDVKSSLNANLGGGIKDIDDNIFKALTQRAKKSYRDGTFIVDVAGTTVDHYVSQKVGSKIGYSDLSGAFSRRVIYSNSKGDIALLSDMLKSAEFQVKLLQYFEKENIKRINISLVSNYGNRYKKN